MRIVNHESSKGQVVKSLHSTLSYQVGPTLSTVDSICSMKDSGGSGNLNILHLIDEPNRTLQTFLAETI